jgi:HK97 family phage major capsid protein
MSLQKIRELNEQIAKRNEGDLQPLRVTLRDSKNEVEVREAKTKIDKILDEIDVLVAQRDAMQTDLNRESRLTLIDPSGRREAPISAASGDKCASVAAYNRSLRRHGVSATRDARGELIVRNHAIEKVSDQVRETIEQLEERYWVAFRNYTIAQRRGDVGLCSAEDRAIMLGQIEEFRLLGVGETKFSLSEAERRDMGIGSNTLGGYFVPRGFVYEVEEAMKWYGSMLMSSEIMDTATGQPLPYPTDNDTTNTGEIVGEGKQVSMADVTIGQILFGAEKFSTKMVKASLELLQDSAFAIAPYLRNKFAIRLGRILNTKFTLGVGASANPVEPTGLVTAVVANCVAAQLASAGVVYGTGLLAAGSSPNTGGAETGGTSIGSQDLTDLEHTVDPAYRKGASYMFHDQTLRTVKRLLDKYGHPLWKQTMVAGEPDRLNNYPYWINNDMATIAVNAKTVLFGDMKKYLIRRVKELGVITLNERFADYGQVAYLGFARYDGNLLDAGTHPVCFLQQAAA